MRERNFLKIWFVLFVGGGWFAEMIIITNVAAHSRAAQKRTCWRRFSLLLNRSNKMNRSTEWEKDTNVFANYFWGGGKGFDFVLKFVCRIEMRNVTLVRWLRRTSFGRPSFVSFGYFVLFSLGTGEKKKQTKMLVTFHKWDVQWIGYKPLPAESFCFFPPHSTIKIYKESK